MVIQFKARILGYIDYRIAAVYHANATVLAPIDRLYEKFLKGIGISTEEILTDYSLAPLSARRDMAMLAVIHRAVLGRGPEQLQKFFPLDKVKKPPYGSKQFPTTR